MHKKLIILPIITVLTVTTLLPLVPQDVDAATAKPKPVCEITITTGEVIKCTLSSLKPSISGTDEVSEEVKVSIYKEGSTKVFYSKTVNVRNEKWKMKSRKKFPIGKYEIKIVGQDEDRNKTTINGTMVVSKEASTKTKIESTLAVSPIPLLGGGIARAGTSVPISYLQITNIGSKQLTLTGFNVKQNGSANAESVIGFTLIDDRDVVQGSVGGVQGNVPLKNNLVFVPANVVFEPGQMRLFTIKTTLSNNSANTNFGKNLIFDIISVETNGFVRAMFPVRGTTWVISN